MHYGFGSAYMLQCACQDSWSSPFILWILKIKLWSSTLGRIPFFPSEDLTSISHLIPIITSNINSYIILYTLSNKCICVPKFLCRLFRMSTKALQKSEKISRVSKRPLWKEEVENKYKCKENLCKCLDVKLTNPLRGMLQTLLQNQGTGSESRGGSYLNRNKAESYRGCSRR